MALLAAMRQKAYLFRGMVSRYGSHSLSGYEGHSACVAGGVVRGISSGSEGRTPVLSVP